MKTLLTTLPMLAFYLALVCGRRLGPTDTTLFVVNSAMQIILFAFMARALLKWRRRRDFKHCALVIASVFLASTAAYHPTTSPRTLFYEASSYVWRDKNVSGESGTKDTRPSVAGTDDENQTVADSINNRTIYNQPRAAGTTRPSSLATADFNALPIVDYSSVHHDVKLKHR